MPEISEGWFKPDWSQECGCEACLSAKYRDLPFLERISSPLGRMILCETCGNKRCPHATDHRHACTHSNDSGQPGSKYE